MPDDEKFEFEGNKESKVDEELKKNQEIIDDIKRVVNAQPMSLPEGAKFILLFQAPDQPLAVQTGGFIDLDQMMGFARRAVHYETVERMIVNGVQQKMQQAQAQQQGQGQSSAPPKEQ